MTNTYANVKVDSQLVRVERDGRTNGHDRLHYLPASAVGNTIGYETICQFNMTEASIIYRTRTNKIRKQNKRKKQRRTKMEMLCRRTVTDK